MRRFLPVAILLAAAPVFAQTLSSQHPREPVEITINNDRREEVHDSFGRLRVSNPYTQFDSVFQYSLAPLIYETSTANGGAVAHAPAYSSAQLTTAAQASSSAIIQSKRYHRYIPGKSQLVLMTGVFGSAVTNVTKRMGYFDANNGVFLQQAGTGVVSFCVRSDVTGSIVDNCVAQTAWNLDRLDGSRGSTDPAGLTLDLTKTQILVIDLQWLGSGEVRIGFNIDGVLVYVHSFKHANRISTPYMRTANLPTRWEISGNGVATLYATCASVQSEGGADPLAYDLAYSTSLTAGNGTATVAGIFRASTTFNGITNRMVIDPTSIDAAVTGNNPVRIDVYYGVTVGGSPAWQNVDSTYSGMQVDSTGTVSGGVRIASFYIAASAPSRSNVTRGLSLRYPITLNIAGTGYNYFAITATGIGGSSACHVSLNWREVR